MKNTSYKTNYRIGERVYVLTIVYEEHSIFVRIKKDTVRSKEHWGKKNCYVGYELKSWWNSSKIDHNWAYPNDMAPLTKKGYAHLKQIAVAALEKELRKTNAKSKHINKLINFYK